MNRNKLTLMSGVYISVVFQTSRVLIWRTECEMTFPLRRMPMWRTECVRILRDLVKLQSSTENNFYQQMTFGGSSRDCQFPIAATSYAYLITSVSAKLTAWSFWKRPHVHCLSENAVSIWSFFFYPTHFCSEYGVAHSVLNDQALKG